MKAQALTIRLGIAAVTCAAIGLGLLAGCGGGAPEKKDQFFTSGSREADQRAGQRMAKSQQMADEEQKSARRGSEGEGGASQIEERKTLYERLGAEQGIAAIIDDYLPRVLQDPRVNWTRLGVERGGLLNKERGPAWQANAQNVARLKKHMAQFLSLATGGPAKYEGKQMVNAHQGMDITNPEFDAAIGDLKATLDHLKIADAEQKELLAVIESTRPQIVTKR